MSLSHENQPPKLKIQKSGDSYRHGDLREACMAVGLDLVREFGADKLSLREVARRAGVSPSAPYKHFSNKETLLAALASRGFETFEQYLRSSAPQGLQLIDREQFFEMGRQYVTFAEKNPDYYRLMFTNVVPDHADYPDLMDAASSSFSVLLESLQVMQSNGQIINDDPNLLASHIWASLNGFVMINLELKVHVLPEDNRSLAERFTPHMQLLFDGLATE